MLIDCHAHHVAAPYNTNFIKWLKQTECMDFGPIRLWSHPAFEHVEELLEKMKQNGIDLAIIIYSSNIVRIVDVCAPEPEQRPATVRDINNRTINVVKHSNGKIATTALIDLRFGKESLNEMSRTSQDVVGFSVLSAYSINGKTHFLDSPIFEPFWSEAEKMGKPVFVHFSDLYRINDPEKPLPGLMNDLLLNSGMGHLMEDALCLARLVLSGVFDRHPKIRIVTGQLGGMYPFMLERFELLYGMYGALFDEIKENDPKDSARVLRNMKDYTNNIYADAHSMSTVSILCAAEILGNDKILYGSDYPITPGDRGINYVLKDLHKLPKELKDAIFFKNAMSLMNI